MAALIRPGQSQNRVPDKRFEVVCPFDDQTDYGVCHVPEVSHQTLHMFRRRPPAAFCSKGARQTSPSACAVAFRLSENRMNEPGLLFLAPPLLPVPPPFISDNEGKLIDQCQRAFRWNELKKSPF